MPRIVHINETIIRGANPNALLQKAVLISIGGTTLNANAVKLVSTLQELEDLLKVNGTAIATNVDSRGTPVVQGNKSDKNKDVVATQDAKDASDFDPAKDLRSQAMSWFANSQNAVYVLELGAMQPDAMGTAFKTWYTTNQGDYYAYVMPRGAQKDTTLVDLTFNESGNTARVYFFFNGPWVEEGDPSYSAFIRNGMASKSVFFGVEHIGFPADGSDAANPDSENLAASVAAQYTSANPGTMNRLAAMNYRQLVGITPWPERGNDSRFQKMREDGVNFCGESQEGGLPSSILYWGTFMSGDPMVAWYAGDYIITQLDLQMANILIEAAQPGAQPLIYDASGILQLEARARSVLDGAVTVGCALTPYTLTAIPFQQYIAANPQDYQKGIYNGLSATVAVPRGILEITFNIGIDFSGQTVINAATQAQ